MPRRPILRLEDVSKSFPLPQTLAAKLMRRPAAAVQAAKEISLELFEGETLGLVGESGCGKSTLGRLIVRLLEPDAGRIVYRGDEITRLRGAALRTRRTRLQMIFQDPYSSLNPRMSIGDAIAEPLRVHRIVDKSGLEAETRRLLEQVGLLPSHASRYPFELSGGQRQRVGIARALAVRPDVLVADEAVSGLDVSVQAQVMNLLADLRSELRLTMIFISHDLGVVEYLSDRIGVMYLGRLVELGGAVDVFRRSAHPYSEGLVAAIPLPDPKRRAAAHAMHGELPSRVRPPSGCVFRTRCPHAAGICAEEVPAFVQVRDGHGSACHFAHDLVRGGGTGARTLAQP